MKYKTPLCSCVECNQIFSQSGINTHYIRSHTDCGPAITKAASESPNRFVGGERFKANCKIKEDQKRGTYKLRPNYCKQCTSALTFNKRNNSFCNTSCAAIYNNARRDYSTFTPGPVAKPKEIKLEYSTVYNCTCKHCGFKWLNRSRRSICDQHRHLYSHEGRAMFWFTHNVFKFPDLYDLTQLKTIGFRSAENPNGVTRDHRVSVNEAILNGYDPYYIKHPINCELMLFPENNKKHTKSSITYDELKRQVQAYDDKIGTSGRTRTFANR